MDRRKFLSTSCALLSVGIAGCSSEPDTGYSGVNGTPEPADLQIDTFRVEPGEVELNESFSLVTGVSNRGEIAGKGEVWFEIEDSVGVRETGSFLVDLEGGKSETFSETYDFHTIGNYTALVNPDRTRGVRGRDHSASIAVVPKELTYGASFENYEGYTLTVEDYEIRGSYEARSIVSGEIETYEPESNDLFAFVEIRVSNDGGASKIAPTPDSFFARVGGEAFGFGVNPLLTRPEFRGDLEGIELYTSGKVAAKSARTGYLVFEVPVVAREQFHTGWSSRYSPNQVVYWV